MRGRMLDELAWLVLGTGIGILVGSGQPLLGIALAALGILILIWVRVQVGPQARGVASAVVILLAFGGARYLRDEPPEVTMQMRLVDSDLADGSTVDGLQWQKSYRRYLFSLSNPSTGPIIDMQVSLYMPDLVVQASEDRFVGVGVVHLIVPRGEARRTSGVRGTEVLPDAMLNRVTLSASRLNPGGSLWVSVITDASRKGKDAGHLVLRTHHPYWGDDISDPQRTYRIDVVDSQVRSVSLDATDLGQDVKVTTFGDMPTVNAPKGLSETCVAFPGS